MFTKLKLYAGIALTALIGFLGAMVSIRTSQRDKAVAETEKAKADLDKVVEVNEHNKEVKKVHDSIQDTRDTVISSNSDDVDSMLSKYDRARGGKD